MNEIEKLRNDARAVIAGYKAGDDFDAVVMDDASLVHPQELSVTERLERAVYLGLDCNGICAKYIAGEQIML